MSTGEAAQAPTTTDEHDRKQELRENLRTIEDRIAKASASASRDTAVRLVAVSKLKPASDVRLAYELGHRHFGENYIQELIGKAAELPDDVRWHFIGGLQSNKCKLLASSVPNLWAVETLDSEKKATELDKGRAQLLRSRAPAASGRGEDGERPDGAEPSFDEADRLRVMIQVNTSGEASKSGVAPGAATLALARHVVERCPSLRLAGLMTIGALGTSRSHDGPNADFGALVGARRALEAAGVPSSSSSSGGEDRAPLELSMGMSEDFADAVGQGSDEVRVGSKIFGARPPRKSDKVERETAEGQS